MKFSGNLVNAFYGADQETKESIRSDVLSERYVDLLDEKESIENLLNISEEELENILFDINVQLFNLVESIIPDLFEPIQEQQCNESNQVAEKTEEIRNRERVTHEIKLHKQKLIEVRSVVENARVNVRGTTSPSTKSQEMRKLRSARKSLAKTLVKGKEAV